ncbi:MAG: recombinase family protein [Pseudomonadota bacterium]
MSAKKALIYCRVSSKSQETDGHGLDSQEARCRAHAEARGYEVVSVFPDTITGGGDYMKRPGMLALLMFIDAQPDEEFVIVFDDLKRMSRDTRAFLDLRDAFRLRGVKIESPNFSFEDTPEGEFVETVIAAQGQLERKQNGRQVKQKMNVRTDLGFWCHLPPVGYKFEKIKGQGKTLVRDEPVASIVQEALEGYASGRFQTQAEVQRFLNDDPRFPRGKSGRVGPERASQLLQKPIYAGYINSEAYGLSWHKMQHEPLISLATYEKIQERRSGVAKAPKRANIGDDFVLRGIVVCGCCGSPLRSYFAKGRHGGRFPYYMCGKKGCVEYAKSTKRDVLEGEVGAWVKALQPTKGLMALATAMFRKAWEARSEQAAEMQQVAAQQVKACEKEIDTFLDRIVAATNAQVIKRYENKIADLEKQKALLAEKQANQAEPQGSFEDRIEPLLQFLSSPWKLWETGSVHVRRTILKLAFATRIEYCRNEGTRTPELAFPFKALEGFAGGKLVSGGA